MSQKKVDDYKEYKKNRKQIIEKEKKQKKREMMTYALVAAAALVFVIGGIGVTTYNTITKKATQYDSQEKVISDLAGILSSEELEAGE